MPTNAEGEYKRTNGFEKPFDRLQFVSWIISFYLIFSFFLVVLPLMEDTTKIWATIVYALLLSAFVILAVRTGGVDPVDKTTLQALQATPRDIPSSELLYCCFCKCKVHKRSKHCGLCNKCVGDFDHHCKWLNNCVGGTNYSDFFRLINVGVVYTAFHFAISLNVLLSVWHEKVFPMDAMGGSYFKGVDRTGLLGLLISSCGFAGLTCTMLGHLVIFHLYLQHKKLSTYDYILLERARKTKPAPPPASRNRQKIAPEVTETRMDQANGGRGSIATSTNANTETVSGVTMGSGGQEAAGGVGGRADVESISNSASSCAGGSSDSAAGVVASSSRDARGKRADKLPPLSMPKVSAVTPDGHISELLPGSVYLPNDKVGGRGGEEGDGASSSWSKDKKGMLKPLPPLAAPLAAARSHSQDLS